MNNYTILSMLRILKSITKLFINSFFVMYVLNISNNNVSKLGLYYINMYAVVYITIYLCKNLSKSKKRIYLLRIGMLLNFVYFLLIIILKEKVIDYLYLLAVVYGLEEGFYYAVYNNIESHSISNKERAKFSGMYTSIIHVVNIIIPIIFGSIINSTGFNKCTIIVLLLVILQIILSILLKDNNIPTKGKANLKEFNKIVKKDKIISGLFKLNLLNGFIYSGAFSSIITVYIIKVTNTSLELGIFTSIFALISSVLGLMFAYIIPKEKYSKILKYSMILTTLGIMLLMLKVNIITVVIFNFFQTISSSLCLLIIEKFRLDISNHKQIKDKYKVEYFTETEKNLFIGRMIGYTLYIILGISKTSLMTNLILFIFAAINILLSYYGIELRDRLLKSKKVE